MASLLEPPFLAALKRTQVALQRLDPGGQVRWVDPGGIHLTLKFLGEVDETMTARLVSGVGRALRGLQAPTVRLDGLGAFPNRRRPRVLWVGIHEVGEHLARLQTEVERACEALGWPPEGRPFQPHLTVGRVRESRPPRPLPEPLQTALASTDPLDPTPLTHRHVALMCSHLSPRGARYEMVRQWELEASEDP